MYFPEKKHYLLLKNLDLDCAFVSDTCPKTGNDREQAIPQRRSRQGVTCSNLKLVFRLKLRHDFIFRIPY